MTPCAMCNQPLPTLPFTDEYCTPRCWAEHHGCAYESDDEPMESDE